MTGITITQSIVFNLRKAGFKLQPRDDAEDPESQLVRQSGADTGICVRDWTNAGMGFAVLKDNRLLAEGLELREALALAVSSARAENPD
jgi:hypothetical protein